MAGKQNQTHDGSIQDAEQGAATIAQLQQRYVSQLLEVYSARFGAVRFKPNDYGVRVTQRVDFPLCEKESNANLWAFFIAQASYPGVKKFDIKTQRGEEGFIAYISFPIWATVKYTESKREGFEAF